MLGDFTFDQEQYSLPLVKNSNAIATWHKSGHFSFSELQCGKNK